MVTHEVSVFRFRLGLMKRKEEAHYRLRLSRRSTKNDFSCHFRVKCKVRLLVTWGNKKEKEFPPLLLQHFTNRVQLDRAPTLDHMLPILQARKRTPQEQKPKVASALNSPPSIVTKYYHICFQLTPCVQRTDFYC